MRNRIQSAVVPTAALLCCAWLVVVPAEAKDTVEWTGSGWAQPAKPAEGTARGELALVRRLFEDGKYKKAVKAAKKFLKKYPADSGCEEVCLVAGRAEMKRHRYYQAYEWFEKQLNQFPAGRYSAKALAHEAEVAEAFLSGKKRVLLGRLKVGATDEALDILTRIAEHAPGTEIAANALLRVGDYHFEQRQWPEAVNAYDAFLELFPKHLKAAHAMARAAEAAYYSYGGIAFDDMPLLEAEQRYRTLLESYPQAAKKIGAASTLRQITEARAQKLYVTGRFYERTKHPSAAAFYYKRAVEKYPHSHWARDARLALSRLGGIRPAMPAGGAAAGAVSPGRADVPRKAGPPETGTEKSKGSARK